MGLFIDHSVFNNNNFSFIPENGAKLNVTNACIVFNFTFAKISRALRQSGPMQAIIMLCRLQLEVYFMKSGDS